MKRILLSCFVIFATTTMALAQTNAKAAFVSKAQELNTALAHNNPALGHTILDNLNTLMIQELSVTKHDIATAASETERHTATLKNRQQASDYSHIMNIAHNTDIISNRDELKTTLEHFAGTY